MFLKNIIVVGDSFSSNPAGWPRQLAAELNLNLVSYGVGGASWWPARDFLMKLDDEVTHNTDVIVFCHTFAIRLPTLDVSLGLLDHSKLDTGIEKQNAIKLYQKYILDERFLEWAQVQWFKEINEKWGNVKTVHLHCFPWSIDSGKATLQGVNVTPSLMAISLDEIGAKEVRLVNDGRSNHFSKENNTELAVQLADIINAYDTAKVATLDSTKFLQKTSFWKDKEA